MSAVIGSLRANLGLDTAKFEAGLTRAQSRMQAWGNRMKALGAAVAAAFTALAAGAAVAIKANIDMADKVGKLSQAAGITTEELSTLGFAADLSGVSLDTLGTSIKKLGKSMSDALRTPTSEQALAFKALGISITDSGGEMRSQVDVMNDVADRFNGMKDGANKTAIAMALFGRAGADMVPLLNQGADGINKMRQEARELGLELDKTTTQRAEAFNDTLTRIRRVFDGLVTKIAAQLLPTLNSISAAFLEMARDGSSFKVIADAVGWAMKEVARFGMDVVTVLKETQIWATAVGSAIEQAFSGEFSAAYQTLKSGKDKVEALWADHAERVKRLYAVTAEAIVPPATRGPLIDAPSLATAANGMKKTKQAADALNQSLNTVTDEGGSKMSQFFEGQALSMFDRLIDGTFRFKDALKSLASDMARMLANSAIRSLFSSLGGGNGQGGGFFASLFGGFRAMGGEVQGGKGYVVGERGPEYFMPRSSGTVIPNHALASSGGSSMTYAPQTVIHLSGSATEADRAMMLKALDERDRAARAGFAATFNDVRSRGAV